MALVSRLRAIQNQEFEHDITKNLSTLQFESCLSEDEKKLIVLRTQNHAISVSHCALATFIVNVLDKSRKASLENVNQDSQRTTNEVDSLTIGIVGCGRLGRQIAYCLLTYGQILPNKLKISTRRPETLNDLQNKGVECYFNNKKLISSVHVVILCVLPSQMSYVAGEVKGSITSSHVIISYCSSFSPRQLFQMLHTSNIIHPVLHWTNEGAESMKYNHSLDVNTALEDRETVLNTCPIGVKKEGLIVSTDQRLAETIILAVVNLCTDQGLNQEETLNIVHAAIFGESYKKPLACERLTPEHFGVTRIQKEKNSCFPSYNLVEAFENGTPLLKVLLGNESMQQTFASRYSALFEDYIHRKTYGNM